MELTYLDNAATTRHKPESVYAAVERFMREVGTSSGRGAYRMALEADRVVFETRSLLCRLFGIRDVKRLVFMHNATDALNLALKGLNLGAGDRVVISSLEHNAVWRPLRALQRRQGIDLAVVKADAAGHVSVGEFCRAIQGGTRLVVVTHVSNVVGTVLPAREIGRCVKEAGAVFLVDAAQSAGVVPINVEEMGVDLLAFTGHKALFGPPGTGGLYVREGLDLEPLREGGTGSESGIDRQPDHLPDRYEAGTLNTWGLAGLAEGVRFVLETGVGRIMEHGLELTRLMRRELAALGEGVVVYGPGEDERVQTVSAVSFNVKGVDPTEVAFRLDAEFGVMVRAGLHCAPLAHQTIGTIETGAVRASVSYFSTAEDVARLVEAVAKVAGAAGVPGAARG